MENLLVNQFFFLLWILGEVLCDGLTLGFQIFISLIPNNRSWSIHHHILIFQFFLSNLNVFFCINYLRHIFCNQLSCRRLSFITRETDRNHHENNNKNSGDNSHHDFTFDGFTGIFYANALDGVALNIWRITHYISWRQIRHTWI